jgi:uncharacterized membrane protein YhiD involved in acid resistance
MFEDLQSIDIFSVTPQQLFASLMISLACGLVMAFIYRMSYKGTGYSAPFADSIVLLTMVTALVITVIGDNLARAFGLVGAMSIIRFRTALRDTQDIVFIFFALAVGMASGTGLYKLAGTATLTIGAVAFILSRGNFNKFSKKFYVLHVKGDFNPAEIESFLEPHASNINIISYRNSSQGGELFLNFSPKSNSKPNNVTEKLYKQEGIESVDLFYEDPMEAAIRD